MNERKQSFCRFLSAVLLACFLFPALPSLAEEEEEISFVDVTKPPAANPAQQETEPAVKMPTGTVIQQEDGSVILTLTAVGDITIGRNVQHSGKSIYTKELEKQKNDINFIFRNVKDIFQADSVTIANFEGVLADTYSIPSNKKNNQFLFLAPPEYASVLSDNGVEMVTIENNHIGDFGSDGIRSTSEALEKEGVLWANAEHMAEYTISGVHICLLGYQTLNQPYTSDELLRNIVRPKVAEIRKQDQENNRHTIIVVYYHWGEELDYSPKQNQIDLGRGTIDDFEHGGETVEGADLVLGAHSHRINPIEQYKGKYIVYSLANCSFAGNNKPSDMYTFIFQNRIKIKNAKILQNSFRIIPCRISSRKDYNDFAITPLTEQTNIDTVINTLKSAASRLEYAVDKYPLQWE